MGKIIDGLLELEPRTVDGLHDGLLMGVFVSAAVLILILLAVLVICCCLRFRREKEDRRARGGSESRLLIWTGADVKNAAWFLGPELGEH